jgi:hypothetical protein
VSTRAIVAAAIAAVAGLIGAPSALADSSQSSNWAGYAIHRTGVTFTRVIGTWTQPTASCTAGEPTYSSLWVGIGGYGLRSQALEQIGTEADCTGGGTAVSSAWYELVPQASHTIRLTIHPGDAVRASVQVSGREVSLTLADLTRHRSFTRRVRASAVDTGSAEWIVEAPSACAGESQSSCQILPLADFGSAGFSSSSATSAGGHTGSIGDRKWTTTKISLSSDGRQFVGAGGPPGAVAGLVTAVPSALGADGTAFTITYHGDGLAPVTSDVRRIAGRRLVHPALSPSS